MLWLELFVSITHIAALSSRFSAASLIASAIAIRLRCIHKIRLTFRCDRNAVWRVRWHLVLPSYTTPAVCSHIKTKLRSKVLHKLGVCHLMQIVISLCCHLSNWIFQFSQRNKTMFVRHSQFNQYQFTWRCHYCCREEKKFACPGKLMHCAIIEINYYNGEWEECHRLGCTIRESF